MLMTFSNLLFVGPFILTCKRSYQANGILNSRTVVFTVTGKVQVKVKFALEQATKAQRGSSVIVLLFL